MLRHLQYKSSLAIILVAVVMLGCRTNNLTEIPVLNTQPPPVLTSTSTSTPPQQTQTTKSTPTDTPIDETPVEIGTPDTGWQLLRAGLERRLVTYQRADAAVPEKFYMLRIDPDYYRFDIGYHPGEPQRLVDWISETGALIVVNGGYFTESGEATGVIIVNGQSFGTSYQGFGGMLIVTENNPELSWLPQQPYRAQESVLAGLQSFPMLVTPGNQIGYPAEDGIPARRTVIARDGQGRFLFILATSGTYTLHQLSRYLVASDLDLDMALNLDGGSSTGLMLADPVDGVPPFTLLPAVITVHPK